MLAFFCTVTGLLVLPLLATHLSWYPDRKHAAYSSLPVNAGPFSYFERQIHQVSTPIDLLVVGNSLVWNGIKTPTLRRAFANRYGKAMEVISLCANWSGPDLMFATLNDILDRRTVKAILISLPTSMERFNGPHVMAHHWMDTSIHIEAIQSLGFLGRTSSWATQVLGTPRRLLSRLRADVLYPHFVEAEHGWLREEQGYLGKPFQAFTPTKPLVTSSELIFSVDNSTNFSFDSDPVNSYQEAFLRSIDSLLLRNKIPLLMIHIPKYFERGEAKVSERLNWTQFFKSPNRFIGIAPTKLFEGLTEKDVELLYYDDHMNANGAEHFTATMAPAIIEAYEQLRHSH